MSDPFPRPDVWRPAARRHHVIISRGARPHPADPIPDPIPTPTRRAEAAAQRDLDAAVTRSHLQAAAPAQPPEPPCAIQVTLQAARAALYDETDGKSALAGPRRATLGQALRVMAIATALATGLGLVDPLRLPLRLLM